MTSDQYSEKPLPPEKKRCPQCGEVILANAETCWLCLEKGSVQTGMPKTERGRREQPRKPSSDGDGWVGIGILILLVGFGLALLTPGFLLLLLILAAPALIRTFIINQHAQPGDDGANESGFFRTFLSSIGIAVVVGFVALHAFFAGFFVVCTVGIPIASVFGEHALTGMIVFSVGGGIALAGWVSVAILKSTWPKKI